MSVLLLYGCMLHLNVHYAEKLQMYLSKQSSSKDIISRYISSNTAHHIYLWNARAFYLLTSAYRQEIPRTKLKSYF
jgi:hypothetical protein